MVNGDKYSYNILCNFCRILVDSVSFVTLLVCGMRFLVCTALLVF